MFLKSPNIQTTKSFAGPMYFKRCKDYLRLPKNNENFINFVSERFFLASKNSHHTQVHLEYCTMPSAIQTMQNPDKLCVFSLKFFFLWGRFIKRGLICGWHGIYKSREYKEILPNPPRRISYSRDQRNVNHNYANQFMQSSGKV